MGWWRREVQDRFSMRALGRPYRFIPPRTGRLVPALMRWLLPWYMARKHGLVQWEVRGAEKLRASLAAGHGVLLTPNHSRDSDSLGVGYLTRAAGCWLHTMAGWHVLLESDFQKFMIQQSGGFSVRREQSDPQAMRTAVRLLSVGQRPLVIFPEGYVTRTNDRLAHFQEGAVWIAQQAAVKRARAGSKTVLVHPVIFKYQFHGDLAATAKPRLTDLEKDLGLPAEPDQQLLPRLEQVRAAIVAEGERHVFGAVQIGPLVERIPRLIDALLAPLVRGWNHSSIAADVYERVRRLRGSILARSLEPDLPSAEFIRLRHQLVDCTWSLKFSSYDPDYLASTPSVERYLETLESLEEDVRGQIRVNRPWRVVIAVGEPMPVDAQNPTWPLAWREAMQKQLALLAAELNQPLPPGS